MPERNNLKTECSTENFTTKTTREVKDKNRVYYEFYHLDGTENVPEDYKEISFVCLRPDGNLELPSTLGIVCRKIAQKLEGFEGFHFHQLRHTHATVFLLFFHLFALDFTNLLWCFNRFSCTYSLNYTQISIECGFVVSLA